MRFIIVLLLLIIAVGGLFATNPNPAAFEAEIETQIVSAIAAADPGQAGDDVSALLLTTCQLGGSACARLLRSMMDVQVTDNVLFSTAAVRLGDATPRKCYGILTRVLCP